MKKHLVIGFLVAISLALADVAHAQVRGFASRGVPSFYNNNRGGGSSHGHTRPYVHARSYRTSFAYAPYAYGYGGYYGYGYPGYGYGYGGYGYPGVGVNVVSYGNSEAPGYTLGGAVIGGILGGVIGNNSGNRNGWAGAAIGSAIGLIAGSVADNSAVRQQRVAAAAVGQQAAYSDVTGQTTAPAPTKAQPQNLTIINNYYGNSTPMGQANTMFGR